ncbi:T9SS type A sorting domain-containing protein [Spirosoma panaciterrae]|uniref:T9SS type A sorting domain-containing protein n=1 Tax=Spirosoma panaciterrae TaxID=496058 RepID=UPI00035C3A66|nr:T9SS type A sorting domain-containing protein [Spirosoma panaciterrae]
MKRHFYFLITVLIVLNHGFLMGQVTKPTLTFPTGGMTLNSGTTNVSLQWAQNESHKSGSVQYLVYVARVNGTTTDVIWNYENKGDVAGVFLASSKLYDGQTYRWKVKAVKGTASAESSEGTFSIGYVLPNKPSAINPANGTTLPAGTSSAYLKWSGSNTDGTAYSVSAMDKTTGNVIFNNTNTYNSTSTNSFNTTDGHTYQWSVRASKNGGPFAESALFTFSVANLPLATPNPISPKNNQEYPTGTTKVDLVWDKKNKDGTATYEVGVVDITTGKLIWDYVNKNDVGGTTITGLQNAHTYQWAVRSVRNGTRSALSQVFKFSIKKSGSGARIVADTNAIGYFSEYSTPSLYPNPANGTEVYFNTPTSFKLYNSEGILLKESGIEVGGFAIESLASGIYFVKTSRGETRRLIIQK